MKKLLLAMLLLCGMAFAQASGPIPKTVFGNTFSGGNATTGYSNLAANVKNALGNMGKESASAWPYIEPYAPGSSQATTCTMTNATGTKINAVAGSGVHCYFFSASGGRGLDGYVSTANSHGLLYSWDHDEDPSWATGGVDCHANAGNYDGSAGQSCGGAVTSGHLGDLTDFISNLVTRYNGSNGHGTLDSLEMWNEQDYSGTQAQRATETDLIVKAARAVNTSLRIGCCGFDHSDGWYQSGGQFDTLWTDWGNIAGNSRNLDFLSFHGYPHTCCIFPEILATANATYGTGTGSCASTGYFACAQAAITRNSVTSFPGHGAVTIQDTEGSWGTAPTVGWFTAAKEPSFIGRFLILSAALGEEQQQWFSSEGGGAFGQLNGNTANSNAFGNAAGWMTGSTVTTACSDSSNVWTCGFNEGNGKTALAVWNTSGPSTFTTSGWTDFKNLCGATTNSGNSDGGCNGFTTTLTSNSVGIDVQPIFLEKFTSPTISISWNTTSYNFGSVNTGSNAQQSFTLTNTGTGTMGQAPSVSISVGGANYSESDNCSTPLAPNATCSATVTFAPSTTGSLTGTLQATDTTDNIPTTTVALTGSGASPSGETVISATGQSNFARIDYNPAKGATPIGVPWEPHVTSTQVPNGFSCSNPNNISYFPAIAYDPTCSTTIANISTISRAATSGGHQIVTVNLTGAASPALAVGMYVSIAGVTDTSFNQLGVLLKTVPSSTQFTFWQTGSVGSSSGGTVTDGPAAAGATTCSDPYSGVCYFYPSVFIAGYPRGGNGWFIPFMTSKQTVGSVTFQNWQAGQVHAYILGCNTNGTNVNRCVSPADSLHDSVSPPWTASQINGTPSYNVSFINTTGYPSTAVVGVFNSPTAGFNTISTTATFYFNDSNNCPTIPTANMPGNATSNDCVVYQTSTNNTTPTCSNTYSAAGQTFNVCATLGLYPPAGNQTFNSCQAGGDFTANIRNITYRYIRLMHGAQGFVPTSGLSSCGDPNAGLHSLSVHDAVADDIDAYTWGILGGSAGATNGKASQGVYASNATPPHQLYICNTDQLGTYSCVNTTVTHCQFNSGTSTATITLSQDPDINVGQSVAISGMSIAGYNSVDPNNGTVITGVGTNTLSYAATGLMNGSFSCTGIISYPSSASDWFINHVTFLPVLSNAADNRAMIHPITHYNTGGYGGLNLAISQPLASLTNFTYMNSITYGGVQSVPSASSYPNQCGVNEQNSILTLNCVVGSSFAATPSWCYNNNIVTSGSISNDPYQPGVQAYPTNGLYTPLPGDTGYTTEPAAGTCANAPASTIENLQYYDLIGFKNHAYAGTCYPLQPGTPDFYVTANPNCSPAPGVPNYKLNSSSPYINAGLTWVPGAVSGTSCNSYGCWQAESVAASAWSIASNQITITATAHGFTTNQQVYLTGFPTAPFNGQLFTVLASGLGANSFKVAYTYTGTASASEVGCASLTGFCDIGANIDIVNTKISGVYH